MQAITESMVRSIHLAERKLLHTIGFKNLRLVGKDLAVFKQVEDTLNLRSRPEWSAASNQLRDVDVLSCAAATLSPRQVAMQFMLQRYAGTAASSM